jgi:hypothetical protein
MPNDLVPTTMIATATEKQLYRTSFLDVSKTEFLLD